jgi:Holliday junction resolvase RusA-like endonuclease
MDCALQSRENCLKAILDALHQNGIVENDSPKYLQKIEIWRGDEANTFVQVTSTKGE